MISRILSLEAFAGAASLLHDTIFRVLLFREVDEDLWEKKKSYIIAQTKEIF